jgi:chitinase
MVWTLSKYPGYCPAPAARAELTLVLSWEYPGLAGIGCNTLSANDTDNFLAFLTELRAAMPNISLSAATSINPFMSSDLTTPSANVSAFAKVFDYIAIMNYDIWGPWSPTVGPNAPLNDTCVANATQQVGSAVSAVEAWTKAGMPADQIVLGVAGYGHSFSVASTDALTSDNTVNVYAPFNATSKPAGDSWDDGAGEIDVCGNVQTQGGNWNFWGLIAGKFLNENGTANTAEGIAYKFDECSQTVSCDSVYGNQLTHTREQPFVYNKTSGIMVAFDNADSFGKSRPRLS